MKLVAVIPLDKVKEFGLSDVFDGFVLVYSKDTLKVYKQVKQ